MTTKKAKKSTKISQKESWYIFFIVLLSMLLAFFIYLFYANPLAQSLPASTGLKPIGTDLNFQLEDNNSASQSVYFYGSVLPNFEVKQEVFLSLKPTQNDCKVRAKVFMFDEKGELLQMEIIPTTEWEMLADGYSYYNGTLTPNLSLQFLKAVKTPAGDKELDSNNLYLVTISFETLPTSSDYLSIWNLEED